MVKLEGTERQINYAESIRKEVLGNVKCFQKELKKRLEDVD